MKTNYFFISLLVVCLITFTYPFAVASKLGEVGASRIVVKSTVKLSDEGFLPKYSPTGKFLFYTTRNSYKGVILNLGNLKIIKTFTCEEKIYNVAWNPSEKKIAYSTAEGTEKHLNIFEIISGKQFKLDYPGYYVWWYQMLWHSSNEIYFKSDREYFIFNLNDLKKYTLLPNVQTGLLNPLDVSAQKKREYQELQRNKQKQKIDSLFVSNKHLHSFVYQKAIGYKRVLVVANKDGSYERVLLIKNIFLPPTPASPDEFFAVAPDLTSIIYLQDDHRTINIHAPRKLYIAYLGIRKEPKIEFRLTLDKMKQLTPNQRSYFKKYFEGGTIDGYFKRPQSFNMWGAVYSQKINPLNNKVVGPDRNKFKGWIKFIKSYDSYSIVRVRSENRLIRAGDIVSNIMSDNINGRQFKLPQEVWASLKN